MCVDVPVRAADDQPQGVSEDTLLPLQPEILKLVACVNVPVHAADEQPQGVLEDTEGGAQGRDEGTSKGASAAAHIGGLEFGGGVEVGMGLEFVCMCVCVFVCVCVCVCVVRYSTQAIGGCFRPLSGLA